MARLRLLQPPMGHDELKQLATVAIPAGDIFGYEQDVAWLLDDLPYSGGGDIFGDEEDVARLLDGLPD
jgi:hypothetical protein